MNLLCTTIIGRRSYSANKKYNKSETNTIDTTLTNSLNYSLSILKQSANRYRNKYAKSENK